MLTKIGKYESFQVLGRDPLPTTGRHYFALFLDRTTYSIFSVGIASQSRRNYKHSHDHPDCITYFAKTGMVWELGRSRGGGPVIPSGVELRVVVDREKEMVKWFQNGEEIGSTIISPHLLAKRLVPYIQLNYEGDRVTFNPPPRPAVASQQSAL